MLHSVLTLALIDEAVGVTRDVLGQLTIRAQFKSAEQIARGCPHDFLHFPHGLLDPVSAILQDETVMGTTDDRQIAGAREHEAQQFGFISLHREIQKRPLLAWPASRRQ